MLSPPESQYSRDKGALDEKGRERYLNSLGTYSAKGAKNTHVVATRPIFVPLSLEQRLGRLEGGRGRRNQLTSGDILQSLSEARDDHMQQLMNRTEGRTGSWTRGSDAGWTPRASGSGRDSPYSIRNEFADVDLEGGGGSGEVERGITRVGGALGGRREAAVKRRERPKTTWMCCLCCRGECTPGIQCILDSPQFKFRTDVHLLVIPIRYAWNVIFPALYLKGYDL